MEEDSCRVWKMYFSFDFFLRIDRLSFQYLNSESFFWLGTNPPPYGLTAPRQEVKLLTVPLLSSLIPFSTVHLISVITLRLTLWTTSGLRRQFTLDTYCIYTTSWQLPSTDTSAQCVTLWMKFDFHMFSTLQKDVFYQETSGLIEALIHDRFKNIT